MKFEDWMVGKEVEDIETGDIGVVVGAGTPRESAVYVKWKSGGSEGSTLWIELKDIIFINDKETEVMGKIIQIEKLIAEVKQILGK